MQHCKPVLFVYQKPDIAVVLEHKCAALSLWGTWSFILIDTESLTASCCHELCSCMSLQLKAGSNEALHALATFKHSCLKEQTGLGLRSTGRAGQYWQMESHGWFLVSSFVDDRKTWRASSFKVTASVSWIVLSHRLSTVTKPPKEKKTKLCVITSWCLDRTLWLASGSHREQVIG